MVKLKMAIKRISETFPDTRVEILTFLERREEYSNVFTYIFHPENPIVFTSGEYGHIRITTLPENVRQAREFSFASAPQDSQFWFGVDVSSESDYQQHLSKLQRGDTVELFKVRSHMTWPPIVPEVVMIAGGVGVTPFRSMLRDARARSLKLSTTLIHVARSEFLYREELDTLSDEYISTERGGFSDELKNVMQKKPNAHYYIAGSPDFVTVIQTELEEKGIIRIESDIFKGLHE